VAVATLFDPAAAAFAANAAAPLSVIGLSPNNGSFAGGTSVTIRGSGFAAGATVDFGASAALAVTVDSPSTITARAPAGSGAVEVSVTSGGSHATAVGEFAYDPAPESPWLGLNGNNTTYLGPAREFVAHDIVFDRSGPIEWTAGEGLASRGQALASDLSEGMIPVVTIEYRGYDGRYTPDPAFPTDAAGSASLQEYVTGFIATATAIRAAHPGARILFEAINEPWGYTTPHFAGAQYATVIAKLLPAARRAGLPLESIYIGASGHHWVEQMYRARPALRHEVVGWYLHPYGPPTGSLEEDGGGIQSVPRVQAEMTSGQNNIIVSELGFCALDVNAGQGCGHERVAHSIEAAALLTQTLESAAEYHTAGWLRALLIYSRNDGGWAMQLPHGILTAEGEALESFADAERTGRTPPSSEQAEAVGDVAIPPLALAPLTSGLLCSLPGAFVCEAPL
jgi:hypothetical protein